MDLEKVKERWKQYTEKLYEGKNHKYDIIWIEEPEPMLKVKTATKALKNKATRTNTIQAKASERMGLRGVEVMH